MLESKPCGFSLNRVWGGSSFSEWFINQEPLSNKGQEEKGGCNCKTSHQAPLLLSFVLSRYHFIDYVIIVLFPCVNIISCPYSLCVSPLVTFE
jgi:hypothetical protein